MTEPAPRQKRLCDVCGGYDDAPRHVVSLPAPADDAVPGQAFLAGLPDGVSALAIAELMDPLTYVRHMKCCAANGCLDGTCTQVLEVVGDVDDDQLLAAIEEGSVNHLGSPTAVEPEAQEA